MQNQFLLLFYFAAHVLNLLDESKNFKPTPEQDQVDMDQVLSTQDEKVRQTFMG